jgi:hypothetical protein
MGKYRAHRLPAPRGTPTIWKCMGCGMPLGQVEGGMLRVAAHNLSQLVGIASDRYGNTTFRCRCGASTGWWPKAGVLE